MLAVILIIQAVLLILNFIFSSAEMAVISISESRMEALKKEADKRIGILIRYKENSQRFVAQIHTVLTFFGYIASGLAAVYAADYAALRVSSAGMSIDTVVINSLCIIVSVVLLTFVYITFGEIIPKKMALRDPEKTAFKMIFAADLAIKILYPLIMIIEKVSAVILSAMNIDSLINDEATEEEIRLMAESGSKKGTIDLEENEFIQNVFEFDDVAVEEVCTHRTDVVCLYMEDDMEEWDKTIMDNKHSFYPVCGEDSDDIRGILDSRDYFRLKDRNRRAVEERCIYKPYFIPESMKAATLLKNMKKTGNYFAVAIDEYGGMSGIVTMRDLLELIVGEWKEKDEKQEPEDIERLQNGSWRIRGVAPLDDVAAELGAELPVEEYDTFGGYVFGQLGYVPDDGSKVSLKTDKLMIHVNKIEDHRIEEALVSILESNKTEEGKEEE